MKSAIVIGLLLLTTGAQAANPPHLGWNKASNGARYYDSTNSFPQYRPPVIRHQPPPLVPVKNPDRGGFTYVQTLPVLNARGVSGYVPASGASVAAVSGSSGNWGGGYIGNTYVPPGMVISNPFCK